MAERLPGRRTLRCCITAEASIALDASQAPSESLEAWARSSCPVRRESGLRPTGRARLSFAK
jgi:hypothetical protein